MNLLPRKPRSTNREHGFSLLEVLVAFTILALSLSVLFQIYSQGTRNTSLARDYNTAVIIAQSKLAVLDEEKKIEISEISGSTEQGIHWQRRITSYTDPDPAFFNRNYQLVNVEVSVSWQTLGRDHGFSLKTLRIAGIK